MGLDDSHKFDTLPYNVTQDFDTVMRLATSKKVLDPNQHEHFYFKNDESVSNKACRKFGQEKEEKEEDKDKEDEATEEEKWEHQKKEMEGQ